MTSAGDLLLRVPRGAGEPAALGFTRDRRGRWLRGGFELEPRGRMLALRRRAPFGGDPLRDALGAPGLWRPLPSATAPETWHWTFDLPALRLDDEEREEDVPDQHPCAWAVAWAEALDRGSPPGDAPSRGELEEWITPDRCSVRAGSALALIEPILDGPRFRLAIPELARLGAELPPSRAAWVAELCRAGHEHWHLVRLGLDGDRVRAEVDLSGAPVHAQRALALLALAALRCAVEWALPALRLISDPNVSSDLLDHQPRWADARLHSEGERA